MIDGFPTGVQSLFLREISEPVENDLRVVVVESTTLPDSIQIPDMPFSGRPIVASENSDSIELIWVNYVAYAVENESYTQIDVDDIDARPLPSLLRIRRNSPYLRYIAAATFATDEYPGRLIHWELLCENHIVNVVSTAVPLLRKLAPGTTYTLR